ncbi:MAG: DUF58 domain-containing protein [Cyanobacteriota bacterium]|nr:DUF58 domain-containing protein [Cyanobacteriota bacterium]
MIPSQRVYFLLSLGVAIAALFATFFDLTTSLAVTGCFDLVVLGLTAIDGWRVRSTRVEVSREPLSKLSIGRENPVRLFLKFTQKSTRQAARVLIRDDYPSDFHASEEQLQKRIPADSHSELTYTVYPRHRGEFEWGDIWMRQLGDWGLAWHQWRVPQSQTVAVYPDLVGLRSLSIRLTLQSAGNLSRSRNFSMGTEFAELREYTIGDDPRSIDWKATARRAATSGHDPLQVRVLEAEQEQTLTILLDRGRLMTARVKGLQRFDWGLNATLSLALAGLNRGDRVGVGVFDRDASVWLPPERGQHHLYQLIERLTPIQPVFLEPDYMGVLTRMMRQQTRRALVVVITDLVDATASEELLGALQRLTPRYLPFCVTLRDPQVDAIARTPTQDVGSAYDRAVALDLLAQRQVAFARLQRKGVLVLDAPVDEISTQLVDRYLRLKARNRI